MTHIIKILFLLFSVSFISLYASSGIVQVIQGEVYLIRDQISKQVIKKSVIQEGDHIKTGDKSVAKLFFRDNTEITIGKKSQFSINEYLYQNNKAKAEFSSLVGTFKVITGKISKLARHKFKLKVKSASIGIRGTEFYGFVPSKGSEKVFCSDGEIFVKSLSNPKNTYNIPAGFMTSILNGKVSKPLRYKASILKSFEKENFILSDKIFAQDNQQASNSAFLQNTNTLKQADNESSSGNGKISNVVIDSNVKNTHNIATGSHNIAEQNIHSVITSNRGEVEYVYIKGNAKDVANVVSGSNNQGKSAIGSINVK